MNGYDEQDFDRVDEHINVGIWKRLLKYAFNYKTLIFTLVAAMAIVATVDIVYPLMTKYAIDTFVLKNTIEGLSMFILLYVLFVVVQSLSILYFITGGGKLEMRISYDIRQEAFMKLQKLSFSFYDKTPVGYLMARVLSDIARLSEMIAWAIIDVFWSIAFLIGVLIAMFILNWKLALIVIVIVPPLAILCVLFQKAMLKYQRKVRKTNSKITGAFNEGIMGAVTTKTLVREEKNAFEFKKVTGEMKHASIRSATLSFIFMPLVMLLGSVGTALALYYGGSDVLQTVNATISIGTLAAFIAYTTQFFEPIQGIARIFAEMQSAQASAERVLALIDTPCEIEDSAEIEAIYGDCFEPKRENFPKIQGEIDFENVDFAYNVGSSEQVLDNFNLHVDAGQTIALVGETGAGKSTIVNLICRFYEPTSGRILIDGVDYRERSQAWLQSSLGYVLQQPHLFSGSIFENIAYGRPDATEEEVIAAAKLVHAHDFITKQDKGYYTEVGEGGVLLSTGQKQLLSFARVILADPKIFVLDEATSSIDTETEQLIQFAIKSVLKGRTSFIVAHRLSTIRNADRILVIRGGKITENGTHSELLELKGYYYDLYTNQFKSEAADRILYEKPVLA